MVPTISSAHSRNMFRGRRKFMYEFDPPPSCLRGLEFGVLAFGLSGRVGLRAFDAVAPFEYLSVARSAIISVVNTRRL